MERIKRTKLKFPCLFGGNEESRRRKNIQSWSPDNVSVEQSLCKFEVGKSTCKQRNEKPKKKFLAKGIPNGTSAKKRSEGILLKLMGGGGLSSALSIHKQQRRLSDSSSNNTERMANVNGMHEDLEASHVAKMKSVMKELMSIQGNSTVKSIPQRTDSNSDLMTSLIQQPDSLLLKHLHDHKGWKEEEETRCDPFAHLERKEVSDSNIPGKSIVLLMPNGTNAKTVDDSLKEYGENIECFSSVAVTEISESLHVPQSVTCSESEVIGGSLRIIFDQNDRMTHSSSNMSELSLITEAKNRISERLKMTSRQEDGEMVSKGSTLGEIVGLVRVKDIFASPEGLGMAFGNHGTDGQRDEYRITTSNSTTLLPSFNDPNYGTDVCDEGDADEKVMVYSEPHNRDGKKDIQESQTSQKSGETFFENGGPDIYQLSISDIEDEDNDVTYASSLVDEVDGYKIETPFETMNKLNPNLASRMVGDTNSSWIDEHSAKISQLSGLESDYCESLKEVIHGSELSLLEAPPSEDVSSVADRFERLTSQLQEIKKQLHLLKVGSKSTSNRLKLTPKVKHLRQRSSIPKSVNKGSSIVAQIQKASGSYAIDADTFPPPYQNIHHPIDPRLFFCLEKYYLVSKSEESLFHDRIKQTFIRTSKSMLAYPWVNPAKRESQLRLNKFRIEDQVHKVIDEIDKENDQSFDAIHLDKDPDWSHPMNEIDSLGKLIGELVLNDLVLEFLN